MIRIGIRAPLYMFIMRNHPTRIGKYLGPYVRASGFVG